MMNERELKLIKEITEIGLHLAELKAENKILKDVNEKLMQALRMPDVVGRSEQLLNRCATCGRSDEERLNMTSMCSVSVCPYYL